MTACLAPRLGHPFMLILPDYLRVSTLEIRKYRLKTNPPTSILAVCVTNMNVVDSAASRPPKERPLAVGSTFGMQYLESVLTCPSRQQRAGPRDGEKLKCNYGWGEKRYEQVISCAHNDLP